MRIIVPGPVQSVPMTYAESHGQLSSPMISPTMKSPIPAARRNAPSQPTFLRRVVHVETPGSFGDSRGR